MDFLPIDTTWILAIVIVLILSYLFSEKFSASNKYWKDLGLSFVPRIPLFGNSQLFYAKPFHEVDQERYNKFGRMYGVYEGPTPVLFLADPEMIRKVWVKDFSSFTGRRTFGTIGDPALDNMLSVVTGDQWKRIRSVMSPSFATGKIKRMNDIVINSAETLAENISKHGEKPVDIKTLYNTFTMDVIASVAFGTKVHSYNDPNNKFVQSANEFFSGGITWRTLLSVVLPSAFRLLGISPFPGGATKFFKKAIEEIIKDRKASGKKHNDFLQLMIDAEEEFKKDINKLQQETQEKSKNKIDDVAEEAEENDKELIKSIKNFKALSNDEILSQCFLFFLGGFDTVASTLCFACNYLAEYQETQKKLRDEIDSVTYKYGGKVTYDGIQEMKYLDNVINETLRLSPPAVRIERKADNDYEFENIGITIKKGTVVAIPVYCMHHDPEFFPDPEKFMPERFDPEEKANRNPYTYLPFGAGPRNCVAMRFALMEAKICLAYIISQFELSQSAETKNAVKVKSNIFGLLQPNGIMLHFKKRNIATK